MDESRGCGSRRVANARTDGVALAIARDIDDRYEQARALTGLGHAHAALGDHAQARRDWQQALAIYTDLRVPDAEAIRACLDEREPAPDG